MHVADVLAPRVTEYFPATHSMHEHSHHIPVPVEYFSRTLRTQIGTVCCFVVARITRRAGGIDCRFIREPWVTFACTTVNMDNVVCVSWFHNGARVGQTGFCDVLTTQIVSCLVHCNNGPSYTRHIHLLPRNILANTQALLQPRSTT